MGKGLDHDPYRALHYPMPLGFNGWLAMPYRWFSGRPLNGHRYTDATGFRYGTKSLDPSGHANAYQLLPGYKRFLYVRLPLMLAPPAAVLAQVEPERSAVAGGGLLTLAAWEADKYRRVRKYRRQVVEPVAIGVSAVIRKGHVKGQGFRWVDVPQDFRDTPESVITIQLPLDWLAEDGDRKRLVDTVAGRLNLEELSATYHMEAGRYWVDLKTPPKPPAKVSFTEAREDMEGSAEDAPLMGYGPRGGKVTFSLKLESPHLAIAGGSGAGKSVLIAAIVGQFLRKGYGAAILDAKFTSHMWARKIPGVLYAAEAQELHDALIWLDGEMLRRARFVSSGGDPKTLQPLVAVLEEMNGATNRLRQHWQSIKQQGDPMMSPALTALGNLSAMGRELRVHIIMAGQSLTGKATGGPENRENFGARALARATANQWKMLAPQIKPAPTKRQRPGRWHLVVGDTLRELQAPFIDLKGDEDPLAEAKFIEWCTSGEPFPDVYMLMMTQGADRNYTRQEAGSSGEGSRAPGVSLSGYVVQNPDVTLTQLQNWRKRYRPEMPNPIRTVDSTPFYDPAELDAFVRTRLGEPVESD